MNTEMPVILFIFSIIAPIAASVIALFTLIRLLHAIFVLDHPTRKGTSKLTSLVVPANFLLVGLSVSLIMYGVFMAIYNFRDRESPLYLASASFFCASMEIGYVFFSFIRSSDILRQINTPFIFQTFTVILYITPIAYFLPIATLFHNPDLRTRSGSRDYMISMFFAGSVTLSLDVFFAISFVIYMRKATHTLNEMNAGGTRQNMDTLNRKFDIIARYGLISNCFAFFTMAMFAVSIACIFLQEEMRGIVLEVYEICWGLKDFGFCGVMMSLLGMKVALVKERPQSVCNEDGTLKRNRSAKECSLTF